MGAVESDGVKSARKAKDMLHKPCERASETREQTLHGQEQNRMRMASLRESRDSDRFLVNTQVQSHALLRRGFGTSVPFIQQVLGQLCAHLPCDANTMLTGSVRMWRRLCACVFLEH